jgi:RNA polymerase sigma-70 factor (ECF subfamily)
MKNYVGHERERAAAWKRGGRHQVVSLDDDANALYERESTQALAPDALYEKRWALTVINRAMTELRRQYEARGQLELFEQLQHFVNGRDDVPVADVAAKVNLSLSATKSAIHRLRQACRALVREEIGHTVSDPAGVDAELRHLIEVLQQ